LVYTPRFTDHSFEDHTDLIGEQKQPRPLEVVGSLTPSNGSPIDGLEPPSRAPGSTGVEGTPINRKEKRQFGRDFLLFLTAFIE